MAAASRAEQLATLRPDSPPVLDRRAAPMLLSPAAVIGCVAVSVVAAIVVGGVGWVAVAVLVAVGLA